jgi:hypothetical protein
MKRSELYWLAGLLEGEGSFMAASPSAPHSPRVSLNMTDSDVVARAAALVGPLHIQKRAPRLSKWKASYAWVLRGQRAVKLMRLLRPLMGLRRREQIDAAIFGFIAKPHGPGAILTPQAVGKIRRSNQPARALAVTYGVSTKAIYRIRQMRTWKAA